MSNVGWNPAEAVRVLIGYGHRRIIFICHRSLRQPTGASVEVFRSELAAHGIPVSSYNLPGWEETAQGLDGLLKSLFHVTPPTALIIDDVLKLPAVLWFLASRRLVVPEQLSLVVSDHDPSFGWCVPPISHIHFDIELVIGRVIRWAAALGQGGVDHKRVHLPAVFVQGGTVGPAPAA